MKLRDGIIIITAIILVIVFWIFNAPIQGDLPWRTEGNYFTIEWITPENVAYYRGFISSSREKIIRTPFQCQKINMPPPLKPGEKERITVHYKLMNVPYDLYVEVYAFDIDGNYCEVNLLHFEE